VWGNAGSTAASPVWAYRSYRTAVVWWVVATVSAIMHMGAVRICIVRVVWLRASVRVPTRTLRGLYCGSSV
jgi:uncharacterized membrane protein